MDSAVANTRRGMGCSAAGRVQHSQDIPWQPDRKRQDWFDANDQELQHLMSRSDHAHQRELQTRNTRSTTAAYKDACRLLQKRTCALKSDWWEMKAVELQRAADSNNMKGFYNGLNELCGDPKRRDLFN